MLYLRMYQAEIDQDAAMRFADVKSRLAQRLRPLLSPALSATATVLGVTPDALGRSSYRHLPGRVDYLDPSSVAEDGEIFTDGQTLIVVAHHIERPQRGLLRTRRAAALEPATEVVPHRLSISQIGPCRESKALEQALAVATDVFGVTPTRTLYASRRFGELRSEGREPPPPPSAEEDVAAALLADRDLRTLALAIKAAGGLLVRDLAKQLPTSARDKADELAERLKGARLLGSEIVVVCTKTQAQVARAPTREIISELAGKGVKCACGRGLADERTEEALTITELGRTLLDKARWLTILLVRELEAMEVPREAVLVEQTVGGDEIDCLANISGELALFELKDKEFNLGNAYSFGAKIAIIRPQHPVIITTERVGNDAKEHFVRARLARAPRDPNPLDSDEDRAEITYIEAVDTLREGLQGLVSSIYRDDSIRLLDEVLPLASFEGRSLLQAFESLPGSTSASVGHAAA